MNQALIIGRNVRDAEVRYTAGGAPVMNLTIATNETRGGGDSRKVITEFHRVVCWGAYVVDLSQRIKAGAELLVLGKISTRSWNDKNGLKREATEIVAGTIRLTQEKSTLPISPSDAQLQAGYQPPADLVDPFDEAQWPR